MKKLQNMSIEGKLTLVIMLTSGVVLLLAASAFLVNDIRSVRQALVQEFLRTAIGASRELLGS